MKLEALLVMTVMGAWLPAYGVSITTSSLQNTSRDVIEIFVANKTMRLYGLGELKRLGVRYEIYSMTDSINMDIELSQRLPSDPNKALAIVQQRLQDPAWKTKMKASYRGRNEAAKYGINPNIQNVVFVINQSQILQGSNIYQGYKLWKQKR